jgi:hypothetical protein
VDRGGDHGEKLLSVGADGRVNSWTIKKGLECREIMRIKRDTRGSEIIDTVISRDSGGMCICLDPTDSNM